MNERLKLYILILSVVATLFLFKKNYYQNYNRAKFYQDEISNLKILNKKFRAKLNTLKSLKAQIKIEEKKIKDLKNRLFKANSPNETLDLLQKYIFDYYQKKNIEIRNYRQLRIIDENFFYRCKFEVNSIIYFSDLVDIIDFVDRNNYLIKIPQLYVYYYRIRGENKISTRIIFETIYLKEIKGGT